jgi:hypothetical protein
VPAGTALADSAGTTGATNACAFGLSILTGAVAGGAISGAGSTGCCGDSATAADIAIIEATTQAIVMELNPLILFSLYENADCRSPSILRRL